MIFTVECLQKRQIFGRSMGIKSQSVLKEIAMNIRDKKTYGGYQNAISFHVSHAPAPPEKEKWAPLIKFAINNITTYLLNMFSA